MNTLTPQDFIDAAGNLDCEVAAIEAVFQVEASRGGFNPDGSVVTLFEGHKFHKFTDGLYDQDNPDISYPKWTRKFYGKTWQVEQDRLNRAIALDEEAALMSASWGKPQIMGFNFSNCGFESVGTFVESMKLGEREQLMAFVAYVQHEGLVPFLRNRDWKGFAAGYNGPGYSENKYDTKLAQAFQENLA